MSHGSSFARPSSYRLWIIVAVVSLAVLATLLSRSAAYGEEPEFTPEQIAFFESKIRPILVQNCNKCHGDEKQNGALRLDSRDALMHGGDSGPTIVPGKPDESLLIEAIKYESFEMPPTGKLAAAEIDVLTEWVKIGAPMPSAHGKGGLPVRATKGRITDEDRAWWAFQPVRRLPAPEVEGDNWSRGEIDRFLLAQMNSEGLEPAPEADRATLVRRLTFDLTGLPPTSDEAEAFVADDRPDAYERLVDRLLASPQYGERWARHWLDIVRYAESDGYRLDSYRPNAWRYRDYVIDAFNNDKPYSQFILEQLAGDEIPGAAAEQLVATGYLGLWMYEYNQRDVKGQWHLILNDITDVTADVFLGMGMSCARCHDHKFDPILQKDYFRLQAFFTPILPRQDLTAGSLAEINEYETKLKAWEEKTAETRQQLAEIEQPLLDEAAAASLRMFPEDTQDFLFKSPGERTPYEEQIYQLAFRQAALAQERVDFNKKLKGEQLEKWKQLKAELAKFDAEKPAPLPPALTASDVGSEAPPTYVFGKQRLGEIEPGLLSVLDENPLPIPPSPNSQTTGRRTALARWMADEQNPLTPRVMVNRIWQYHFGRGLVESASDFGRLGQPPSHPELLDWLASEFTDSSWSVKEMHRRILRSSAYRQVSHGTAIDKSVQHDPSNRLFSRMTVRRLQAEQIRDAALMVTGELNLQMGGPSAEWDAPRRSVYLKVYRNKRDALLDVFDVPDGMASMPIRNSTTTPNQALLMINGPWALSRAKRLSSVVEKLADANVEGRIDEVYRLVLGRQPTSHEREQAAGYLKNGSGNADERLIDICHVLLNTNEFLYVD